MLTTRLITKQDMKAVDEIRILLLFFFSAGIKK